MNRQSRSTGTAGLPRTGMLHRALLGTVPLVAVLLLLGAGSATAAAPSVPVPLSPANGASVLVPFTISWSAVSDPAGIVAYNWEVSPSSTFSTVIQNGSTSGATQATVSGLANGTYFWHVQAVNGNIEQSAWSPTQSFTVKGATAATPGTPTLNPPTGGTNQFHPYETFTMTWSAVPGAASYVFDASKDPSFPVASGIHVANITGTSHTLELADDGIGNWQARVYAVDANGIRGVPSKTQSFSISYSAPLPPPPTPLAPTGGTTVTLPVTLSWTDVPNPQPQGYEVQIATDSGFKNIEDDIPLITPSSREELSLTSGTKFWRVRSFQGDNSPTTSAVTAWSKTASFVVAAGPAAVTGIDLTRTPRGFSGDDEQMRIQLNHAAPAGGTTVTLTSSDPNALSLPASTTIPEGYAFSPAPLLLTLGQVTAPTPVTITASTGSSAVSVSITVDPPSLKSLSLTSTITGGAPADGTLLLNGTAPPAGATVKLASDTAAVHVPAQVTVAAGSGSAQFTVQTDAVTTNTTATVTASWNGGSVSSQITLTPQVAPGSITISPTTTEGTNGASGTVTLAAPVDHDVQITLSSSDPAIASVPPSVTVGQFAGGAGFLITTSAPTAPTTVTITASGGAVTKTATLTVNPFPTGPAAASLTLNPTSVTGGGTSTATVTLSAAAPAGGAAVSLASGNTAAAVPAGITVPAGATTATFTVTSSTVSASTSATISATAGGTTKTAVLTVTPAAAAPADTLSITKAEYAAGNAQLTVEATSTSSNATLKVYVAATGTLVGTLANAGGGAYKGQFSWPSDPQNITIKSSLGGTATGTVTLK